MGLLKNINGKTPDYKITINGKNKTDIFKSRLIRITVTDNAGFSADQVDIELDDADDSLPLPKTKTKLKIWLGFKGEPLIDKGTYTIDEIAHTGPPDKILIKGSSADFHSELKTQRRKAWHETTLGNILASIANRYELVLVISDNLKTKAIPHIDQTNESDANFMTRLGVDYGAIATIKNGRLLFVVRGAGKTASGKAIPTLTIQRGDGDTHNYRNIDRDNKYDGVKARWLNSNSQAVYVLAGNDGTVKSLKKTYPTEKEAFHAAEAELKKLGQGGESFQVTLAAPALEAIPEQPVILSGWKKKIRNKKWIVAGPVTHELSNGLTTNVSLSVQTLI